MCPTAWGMSTCQRLRVSSLFFGTYPTLYSVKFPRKVVKQYYVRSYTLWPTLSEALHKMMDASEEKVKFKIEPSSPTEDRNFQYQEDDSNTLSLPKQRHCFVKILETLIKNLWYKISEGHSSSHEQHPLTKASCIFLVMKKITSFLTQNFKLWDSE